MSDDIEKLKSQIATLTEKVAELEAKAKPKPAFVPGPVGPTTTELAMSRLSMPPSALADMVKVTGSDLMRDLRADARHSATLRPLGGEAPARERGSGWRDAVPLSNPPGVALADKIVDAQDRAERVELAQRLAKQRLAERKGG